MTVENYRRQKRKVINSGKTLLITWLGMGSLLWSIKYMSKVEYLHRFPLFISDHCSAAPTIVRNPDLESVMMSQRADSRNGNVLDSSTHIRKETLDEIFFFKEKGYGEPGGEPVQRPSCCEVAALTTIANQQRSHFRFLPQKVILLCCAKQQH